MPLCKLAVFDGVWLALTLDLPNLARGVPNVLANHFLEFPASHQQDRQLHLHGYLCLRMSVRGWLSADGCIFVSLNLTHVYLYILDCIRRYVNICEQMVTCSTRQMALDGHGHRQM
jgi:hypothetical protein